MNELLDKKTLAAVIAASPVLPGIREEARELLTVLQERSQQGWPWFAAIVQDLANDLSANTGSVVSANAVGSMLRQMGLSGFRTRSGYRYAWTSEQILILDAALNHPGEVTE